MGYTIYGRLVGVGESGVILHSYCEKVKRDIIKFCDKKGWYYYTHYCFKSRSIQIGFNTKEDIILFEKFMNTNRR